MRNVIIILFCFIVACNNKSEEKSIAATGWQYYDGTNHELNDFNSYKGTIITFLAPECPLSENYTKTINDLEQNFKTEGFRFINVFSGKYHSREAIDSFLTAYQVAQVAIFDETFSLAQWLQATVTPEVFVVDSMGKVVYSGAIDNWAVDLGQKRQVTTAFYVRDVLTAIKNGATIPYTKTTAIGCFMEMKKSSKQ